MSPRKMSRPRPFFLLLGFVQIFQPLKTDFLTMQEKKTGWLSRSTLLARSVGGLPISWNRPNPSLSEQLSTMMRKCMKEYVKAKNLIVTRQFLILFQCQISWNHRFVFLSVKRLSLLVKSVCQLVTYLSDPLSISFYLSVRICLFDPGLGLR